MNTLYKKTENRKESLGKEVDGNGKYIVINMKEIIYIKHNSSIIIDHIQNIPIYVY